MFFGCLCGEAAQTPKKTIFIYLAREPLKENMQAYLDLARQGRNNWWRVVLAVLLILFMWQIIGAIPSALVLVWGMLNGTLGPNLSLGSLAGLDTTVNFVMLMLASIFFLCGIFLAMRFLHKRSLRSLVTPARSVDWGRVFQGSGIWFLLVAFVSASEALLFPGRYVWNLDLPRFIPFVFLALVFIPIQTSAEELFFRGYVLQIAGLRLRNIWGLCTLSGVLFGLPHMLNPEASVNYPLLGLYYFAFGFCMAYISLRDGRLELALGAHAANNFFSVIFANYAVTVLPSPSLFTVNVLDPLFSVPAALVGMLVFIWLFTGPLRRKEPALDQPAITPDRS
jgi:uncharacterized protein